MNRQSIDAMIDFVTARLNEDEADAHEAIDAERPGTTWQWFRSSDDAPLTNPAYEDTPAYLATTEEYPSSVGMMPAIVLHHVETDDPQAFPHIARHDPKRVLADVAAKRQILMRAAMEEERWKERGHTMVTMTWATREVVRLIAQVYSDHPDYYPGWVR